MFRPSGIVVGVIAGSELPGCSAELAVYDEDMGIPLGNRPAAIPAPGQPVDDDGGFGPFGAFGFIGKLYGQDFLFVGNERGKGQYLSIWRPHEIRGCPLQVGELGHLAGIQPEDVNLCRSVSI